MMGSAVKTLTSSDACAVAPDLRGFLQQLRSQRRLVFVNSTVRPDTVVPILPAIDRYLTVPAMVLNNIVGHEEKLVVLDVLGSWENCAVLAGLCPTSSVDQILQELCLRSSRRSQFRAIVLDQAPVYECLDTDNIDLQSAIPLLRMNDADDRYCLTKACIVSRNLRETGSDLQVRIAMHSLEVRGKDRLLLHLSGMENLSVHLASAKALGTVLPVAVCLGVPPFAAVAAFAAASFETGEYSLVSALSNKPFETTRCRYSNLLVPAYSEFVLEGYIDPLESRANDAMPVDKDDPSRASTQAEIRVTAIAQRKNPILDNISTGSVWSERDCLAGISTALRIYRHGRELLSQLARSGRRGEAAYLRLEFRKCSR